MKKLLALLLTITLLGLSTTGAQAADDQATEAKVISVKGSATVLMPGATEPILLTPGMKVPMGATVMTGADSTLELSAMAGSLTTISPNSSVEMEELSIDTDNAGTITKQTALLNLKSGNLVSNIDPARKSINNYGVRTPRGVAAARGTVYTVSVSVSGGTTVGTLGGTVTLTPVGGGAPIIVDIGTGLIVDASGNSTGGTLADLVAAEPEGTTGGINDALTTAVEAVSEAVANNTISEVAGAANTGNAVAVLAAVVNVASAAKPAAAAAFATTAVAAVTSPAAVAANGGAAAAQAVTAVTAAAVQGAVQTTAASATSTNAATVAATAQALTNSIASAASTTAAKSSVTVTATAISNAAAAGATTATTNAAAVNPVASQVTPTTVTVTTTTATGTTTTTATATGTTTTTTTSATTTTPATTTTTTTTTPITPVDPSVVSPSGG